MHAGKAIFSQLTDWIHPEQFRRCVHRYAGNHRVSNFTCWEQFLAMTFAQLTYRESLADIEVCLRSRRDQLYHLGFRSSVAHSTLADAKGYHQQGFVEGCRAREIAPHVACKDKVKVSGLDGRTTTQPSYRISLKIRKRVEEIFGWIKTVGGFRRSRYRGMERTQAWGYFVAGTYNLVRMARLGAA